MPQRAVVSVGTGSYVAGLDRLHAWLLDHGENHIWWRNAWPSDCPPHRTVPYAFKARALEIASEQAEILLWADSSIVPVKSLDPLWERIERDGYWIANNAWMNYEWTNEKAYEIFWPDRDIVAARIINKAIPHVMATSFGLNLVHPVGRAIYDEYLYYGLKTRAFCGPWHGEIGVRHRHDQSALSIVAWRHEAKLTNCPDILAYGKPDQVTDSRTILVADGSVNA
ncbi:MAG TPA: hypothetical protein VFO46_02340 [Candidatus Sulfotelmatobacter sp.]|nr:hypothetical protein [Candidatus Sulfotelmatobacter sp.]